MIGQALGAAGLALSGGITPTPPAEGAAPQVQAAAPAPYAAAPSIQSQLPTIDFPQRTITDDPAMRSVYDDLDAKALWLRDKIATQKRTRANENYYFSPELLTQPNKAVEQMTAADMTYNRNLQTVQQMQAEGLQIELLDANEVTKPLDNLRAMLQEIPRPPTKKEMEAPTWMQSVASLVAALVDPTNAGAYAAAPLQYQMQRREEQYQQEMVQYEALKQKFQLDYQIEATRAEQLANIAVANNRARQEQQMKWLDRIYQARLADAASADAWDRTIYGVQVDLMKMDRQQRQAIVLAHVDMLTSGRPYSPEQRAAAAALIKAHTGFDIPTSAELTPAEKQKLEELRGMVLANNFNDRTMDARVQTVGAQASAAVSGAQIAAVEAGSAQEQKDLELERLRLQNEQQATANKYLDEQARAQLAATYAATAGQNLQNANTAATASNGGALNAEQRRLYSEAVMGARKDAQEQRTMLAERKAAIIEDLKKTGQWLNYGHKENGWGPIGGNKLTNEEVDARNQRLLAERLAQDPVAAEHEKAAQQHEMSARQLETYLNAGGTNAGKNPVGAGDLGKRYQEAGLKYSMERRGQNGYTDCSHFTQCVYRDMGKQIPGTAATQWREMTAVPRGQESLGDLIFFKDNRPSAGRRGLAAHHVGIIVGFTDEGVPIMRHASSAANKIVDVPLDKYLSTTSGRMALLGVKR